MWRANAAGNLSGAAIISTSGNRTCTEHLTSPDIAVTANTNHNSDEVTNAGKDTKKSLN